MKYELTGSSVYSARRRKKMITFSALASPSLEDRATIKILTSADVDLRIFADKWRE